MPIYKEITCAMACNKLKPRFHFTWDLNIYRGCEHGCRYCFAVYSHEYLGNEKFFEHVFVKTNIAESLEKQLSSPSWKHEIVNIGGVTDSYQPAERQYRIMPEVLRLMIKYRTPCIISTKSDLILRDYDLIDELSKITYVNIAATITCKDENTRAKIEPGAVSSERRLKALREFSKTSASTGLHLMPIIPYITDSYENIDWIYANAKDANASYVLPCVMNLRGKTRVTFFDFIKNEFPYLYDSLQTLYKTGGASTEYKGKLYKTVNDIKYKYQMSGNYLKLIEEKLKDTTPRQLSLF
ncbi:MAG: radical SAM protein [Synergistaceae bacterium]|nr:radical SAM protein [Synergistaceae bacterium]